MKRNSLAEPIGRVMIEVRDENGRIKDYRYVENLIVTAGRNYIASRMKDASATAMSHMAVGTNTVAAALGDTTLGAQSARVALTSTTVTTNSVAYVGTFGAGVATATLGEAGIFNDVTTGTMLARTTFTPIVKGASDVMTITWTVTIQ